MQMGVACFEGSLDGFARKPFGGSPKPGVQGGPLDPMKKRKRGRWALCLEGAARLMVNKICRHILVISHDIHKAWGGHAKTRHARTTRVSNWILGLRVVAPAQPSRRLRCTMMNAPAQTHA